MLSVHFSFITGGIFKYQTPYGGAPENSINLQNDHATRRYRSPITRGHQHGGNRSAPATWAERVRGTTPKVPDAPVPEATATSFISRIARRYRYWYRRYHVCYYSSYFQA